MVQQSAVGSVAERERTACVGVKTAPCLAAIATGCEKVHALFPALFPEQFHCRSFIVPCSRLVVFVDGMNDLEMFGIADEAYATENVVPELKQIATGVIGNNDEDAVAHWLEENAMNYR